MLEIIETQHRPLTDEEFGIIRSHPNRGGQYLSIDEDLARYVDIARGHHKFYNGKGGYPNDFDNTVSPECFMIDIITVCDCLDAATDQYGRTTTKPRRRTKCWRNSNAMRVFATTRTLCASSCRIPLFAIPCAKFPVPAA